MIACFDLRVCINHTDSGGIIDLYRISRHGPIVYNGQWSDKRGYQNNQSLFNIK